MEGQRSDAPHVTAANPYPTDISREDLRFSARVVVNDGIRATKLAIPSCCGSKGQQCVLAATALSPVLATSFCNTLLARSADQKPPTAN